MLSHIFAEELSRALDQVVEEILESTATCAPPVDALTVARRLGLTVATDAAQAGRARLVRLRGAAGGVAKTTILLRPADRPERAHWALAHEIGEHCAHRVFGLLDVDPREARPNAREEVANQLANRILLPEPWFREDGTRRDWDLFALKEQYSTASHELIARRMLDVSSSILVSIFDQGELYFRRGSFSQAAPPLLTPESECWRVAHEQARIWRSSDEDCTARAWPVHEATWRREILRTDLVPSWE